LLLLHGQAAPATSARWMPLCAQSGLGEARRQQMEPLAPRRKSALAPPLLLVELRGERVPKQTSAEATNGKPVPT
jgi:hypothetical protein